MIKISIYRSYASSQVIIYDISHTQDQEYAKSQLMFVNSQKTIGSLNQIFWVKYTFSQHVTLYLVKQIYFYHRKLQNCCYFRSMNNWIKEGGNAQRLFFTCNFIKLKKILFFLEQGLYWSVFALIKPGNIRNAHQQLYSHFSTRVGVQIKQKIIMNNRQENVYALNTRGYYHTNRPSNHPSIILANERNVHLSYVKCNEIFRGESIFRNPQAEDFYRQSRSLPSKSQMYRSQITDATTNANDDHIKNSYDLRINIKPSRRETRLISTSFHSGNSRLKIDNSHGVYTSRIENEKPIYQYEQTNKLQIPKTLEQFKNFKSETLMREVNKNQGSSSSKNELKLIKTLQQGARLDNSYHLSELSKSNVTKTNGEAQIPVFTPRKNQQTSVVKIQAKANENKFREDKEKQSITQPVQKKQTQKLNYLTVKYPYKSESQIQTPQKVPISQPQPNDRILTPQHPTVYTTQGQQIYTPSKPAIVYRSTCKELTSSPQVEKNMTPSTVSSYFIKQTTSDWSSTSKQQQQYTADSPRTPQYLNPQVEQLNRLRLELARRDQELLECKKALEASQKKNKSLQLQVKKLQTSNTQVIPASRSVIISSPVQSSYNSSHQLSKQLGGPMNALLYFTLFIVLVSKEMVGK